MKKMFAVAVTSFAAAGVLLFGHMDAQAANTAPNNTIAQQAKKGQTIVNRSRHVGINESSEGITTAQELPLYDDSTTAKPKATAAPKAAKQVKAQAASPSKGAGNVVSRSKKVDTFLGFEIARSNGTTTSYSEAPSPTTPAVAKAEQQAAAKKELMNPPRKISNNVAPLDAAKKDDSKKVIEQALKDVKANKEAAMQAGYSDGMDRQVHAYRAGQAPKLNLTVAPK